MTANEFSRYASKRRTAEAHPLHLPPERRRQAQ
jgi:hypothetical protein